MVKAVELMGCKWSKLTSNVRYGFAVPDMRWWELLTLHRDDTAANQGGIPDKALRCQDEASREAGNSVNVLLTSFC